MNWYYADGSNRVGPFSDEQWAEVVTSGKVLPQTLVWNETLPAWTPFASLATANVGAGPAESTVFGSPSASVTVNTSSLTSQEEPLPQETPEEYVKRIEPAHFDSSVSSVLGRGWELYKNNWGLLLGATVVQFILILIANSIPILSLAGGIFAGVLSAGGFALILRLIRDEPASISDLFVGFTSDRFRPLALKAIVSGLAYLALTAPMFIAASVIGINKDNFASMMVTDPLAVAVLALIGLACSLPIIYLSFAWMFSDILIIDKGLGFRDAMRLSRRKMNQRPWLISIILTLVGLVGFVGILGLGIGIVFTFPIYFTSVAFLYLDIFEQPPKP